MAETTVKYYNIDAAKTRAFCEKVFEGYGFSETDAKTIVDVLLCADLFGIESHGIQRLIRYHNAIKEGSIDPNAKYEVLHESPISMVIDAKRAMGQVVAKYAMDKAIEKAKTVGFGSVVVKNANHYGIAGYYTNMAVDNDMIGISMTNTEAIAIPTYGKKAMLGTSPIAVAMPADPTPFWFDAATTVVTRGKVEVYNKKELPLPAGWTADENGNDCSDAARVLKNIIGKLGGGIFPVGGGSELTGSHKGYGLGVIVEIFTSILSGGTTSPHVRNSGNADTSFCLIALDYGAFGDKKEIKNRMSTLLEELRESPKADGHDRIFTHGEKEKESKKQKLISGIPVNEKTLAEMKEIGGSAGVSLEDYISF